MKLEFDGGLIELISLQSGETDPKKLQEYLEELIIRTLEYMDERMELTQAARDRFFYYCDERYRSKSMGIINLTADNFEEVINSNKVVLVDFWATYCGPCKMFSKIVDQIAEENKDVTVCKLNIEDAQELASRLGITAVPTVIIFSDGKEVERYMGMQPKCKLNGKLSELK